MISLKTLKLLFKTRSAIIGYKAENERNRVLSSIFPFSTQVSTHPSNDSNILRCPFPDVEIPSITIDKFVWKDLEKWPDHTAICCGLTGRSYTYHELKTLCNRFGAALRNHGIGSNDVLAFILPNIPECAIVILGAIEAGVILSGINPLYTPDEICHQLSDNNACAIVTIPTFVPNIEAAKKIIESKTKKQFPLTIITIDDKSGIPTNGAIDFTSMLMSSISEVSNLGDNDFQDIAILPYSSGTTGLSKGVELTHRNIVSNMLQMSSGDDAFKYLDDTTTNFQESIPVVLPFYHIYGLSVILLLSLSRGCKLICLPKFEPSAYLSVIDKYKSTILYVAPAMVSFLANHPMVKKKDLDSVKIVFCAAGGPLIPDVERLSEKYDNRIRFRQGYGLTETSPALTMSIESHPISSIGVGTVNLLLKVIAEDGTILGPNERGELCAKGPQVMRGYHNNEKATAEVMDNEGYFHTGDITYYNEEGQLFIVDRKKELIKVKGFQVAPMELENVIKSCPGVLDVGVIGIPDVRTGEKPLAYVVPHAEKKPSEKEVLNYVADKVAPYKQLAGVIFIETIPRNATGKILRRVLRQMYQG